MKIPKLIAPKSPHIPKARKIHIAKPKKMVNAARMKKPKLDPIGGL